jgi:hypothetical protein
VKTAATSPQQRRRIPETKPEPPQVGAATRMSAARGDVVVPVQDCSAFGVKEAVRGERVKHTAEQGRRPTVQQIAGDGEMIRVFGGDAIELAVQPDAIAGVSQVQIREVRDHHASDALAFRLFQVGGTARSGLVSHWVVVSRLLR